MKACSSCPNRHQAETLSALAEAAQRSRLFRVFAPVLSKRAEAIREAGCTWWWGVEYKHKETGQVKTVELCGGESLPKSLEDFAEEIELAAGTVQADRGEQKKALDAIRETAQALGYPDTIAMLAELGFRAAVGHEVVEKQRQAELTAGGGPPE